MNEGLQFVLTRTLFYATLSEIADNSDWRVIPFAARRPVRLEYRQLPEPIASFEKPFLFDPLTAAYFDLTGDIIYGSFHMPEIQREFGMTELDLVEISYAMDACNSGRGYDHALRNDILLALGLPVETLATELSHYLQLLTSLSTS